MSIIWGVPFMLLMLLTPWRAACLHESLHCTSLPSRWEPDCTLMLFILLSPSHGSKDLLLQDFPPILSRSLPISPWPHAHLTHLTHSLPNSEDSLLQDDLQCKPLFPSQRDQGRIVKLQPGLSALHTSPGSNPANQNSSIVLTYQVGPDEARSNALVDLLVHCAKRHVFHVLRTQEQLGYLVFLSSWTNLSVHR